MPNPTHLHISFAHSHKTKSYKKNSITQIIEHNQCWDISYISTLPYFIEFLVLRNIWFRELLPSLSFFFGASVLRMWNYPILGWEYAAETYSVSFQSHFNAIWVQFHCCTSSLANAVVSHVLFTILTNIIVMNIYKESFVSWWKFIKMWPFSSQDMLILKFRISHQFWISDSGFHISTESELLMFIPPLRKSNQNNL